MHEALPAQLLAEEIAEPGAGKRERELVFALALQQEREREMILDRARLDRRLARRELLAAHLAPVIEQELRVGMPHIALTASLTALPQTETKVRTKQRRPCQRKSAGIHGLGVP